MSSSFKAVHYQVNNKLPVRRDFYTIWLVLHKGVLRTENGEEDIQQPALVFLDPMATYSFAAAKGKQQGYWCVFTEAFMGAVEHRNTQVFYPENEVLKTVRFYFDQLVQTYGSEYVQRCDSARKLIGLLIHEMGKLQAVSQGPNAAGRLVNRFLDLLERQYPLVAVDAVLKLKKPADFAGELGVHVNHLNAVVQEVTGKSTREVITARMLSEGKALLNYSDWSVAEIAYCLGFEYANHFTAFFKKHVGETPGGWRR